MKSNYKTKAMYEIATEYYEFKAFNKSFFELTNVEMCIIAHLASLFNIKPRYGVSKARTLFYRLSEYEKKIESGK